MIVQLLFLALLGLVAGWIAGLIMKGRGFGVFTNMGLGLLGALVGGLLFRFTGLRGGGPFALLLVATVGAVGVLAIARAFRKV